MIKKGRREESKERCYGLYINLLYTASNSLPLAVRYRVIGEGREDNKSTSKMTCVCITYMYMTRQTVGDIAGTILLYVLSPHYHTFMATHEKSCCDIVQR